MGGFYAANVFDAKYRYLKFDNGVRELVVCKLMSTNVKYMLPG